MIGIAVKGLIAKDFRSTQTKEDRIRIAQARAAKEVSEDWDEWTAASEKSADGGAPVPFMG